MPSLPQEGRSPCTSARLSANTTTGSSKSSGTPATGIQWTIDTLDWKEDRTAGQVLEVVFRKIAPGAIILCHNNANASRNTCPRSSTTAFRRIYVRHR